MKAKLKQIYHTMHLIFEKAPIPSDFMFRFQIDKILIKFYTNIRQNNICQTCISYIIRGHYDVCYSM